MEIKSFPNNKDEYQGAQDVMRWLHGRTSGVFGAENNAAVKSAGGMVVSVTDGVGWITNADADGVVWWNSTQKDSGNPLKLSLSPADAAMDRIDRIIVEWKTTGYADLPEIKVLAGTSAITAVPPALTNSDALRQLSLARVSIKAGATSITAADITDERMNQNVCGLVTEQVKVDTSVMQEQFEGLLSSIQQQLEDLQGGTAVELKKLLFKNTTVPASAFSENSTYEEEGYPYRAAVALDGVNAAMVPEVVYSVKAAANTDFAPVAESYNGGIYIYAGSQPEEAVDIPTIICWKG